ncbi:histidine phosphatase family protein [Poseidonocella sedimentorum]|uniref:Alpha-ribazole phosphatase n=1 Tax=Poseidonocella sedimentorum TaxID=871652 RepID=A0A1I6EK47_9RHOB|nr:histidine phosphatase family protein [Poseidonocella sedimentorum]SFR18123.1 alpha-ribazole phosphatase [Poseidonocella sedimentorum]
MPADAPSPKVSELILVRHAPADHGGRLCGRIDPPLAPIAEAPLAPVRAALAGGGAWYASPALRCRQTAERLGGPAPVLDARLWEQDFGRHDGLRFEEIPDLGPLSRAELAARRPPGGESFAEAAARIAPALEEIAGAGPRAVVVAHAGTVRAALAVVTGAPAALAFEIAPLSLTRLRRIGGAWSISCVNWVAP